MKTDMRTFAQLTASAPRDLRTSRFEPLFEPASPQDGYRPIEEPPSLISQPAFRRKHEQRMRESAVGTEVYGPVAVEFGKQAVENIRSQEVREIREHFEAKGRSYATRVDLEGVKGILGDKWEFRNNYSGGGVHSFMLANDLNGNKQSLTFDNINGFVELTTTALTRGGGSVVETLRLSGYDQVERSQQRWGGGGYESL